MRIIVSQKSDKYLSELKKLNVTDIIIADDIFSSSADGLDKDNIKKMNEAIHHNNMETIVKVDRLYSQKEIADLTNYLRFLNEIKVDSVLFGDIALKIIIDENNFNLKTIYAPETLLTNSYDIKQLKTDGIDNCIISKDIPLENMLQIIDDNPDYCYLRVFGEILISYGRRRFISAYLREEKEYKDNYFLQEETRDFKMPIVEKTSGCWLYGYCLQSFDILKKINESSAAAIVIDEIFKDDLFILNIVKLHHDILENKIDSKQAMDYLKENDDISRYCSLADVKQTILEKQ